MEIDLQLKPLEVLSTGRKNLDTVRSTLASIGIQLENKNLDQQLREHLLQIPNMHFDMQQMNWINDLTRIYHELVPNTSETLRNIPSQPDISDNTISEIFEKSPDEVVNLVSTYANSLRRLNAMLVPSYESVQRYYSDSEIKDTKYLLYSGSPEMRDVRDIIEEILDKPEVPADEKVHALASAVGLHCRLQYHFNQNPSSITPEDFAADTQVVRNPIMIKMVDHWNKLVDQEIVNIKNLIVDVRNPNNLKTLQGLLTNYESQKVSIYLGKNEWGKDTPIRESSDPLNLTFITHQLSSFPRFYGTQITGKIDSAIVTQRILEMATAQNNDLPDLLEKISTPLRAA